MNVTRDLWEALQYQPMSANLGECTDPENFVSNHVEEIKLEFDEFDGFINRIKKLSRPENIWEGFKWLFLFSNSLHSILCLQDKKEDFDFRQDRDKLIEVFSWNFLENLPAKNESLRLDLSLLTFQAQCHVINDLLMRKVSLPYQKSSTKEKCCSKRSVGLCRGAFQRSWHYKKTYQIWNERLV